MNRDDGGLRRAMEAPENNLVTVINELCPTPETARLSRDHGGKLRSPLPGDQDRTASFSVFRSPDGRVLLFKRHGGDQVGNVFSLLLLLGYSRRQAADFLLERAGERRSHSFARRPLIATRPPSALERAKAQAERFAPVTRDDLAYLERAQRELAILWPVPALVDRGISPVAAKQVGLGIAPGGALVVPIAGPDGRALALKLRRPDPLPEGASRYVYRGTGHGTPAWCSPGYGDRPTVLVCEGELNAVAAWLTMRSTWDVQGIAGTSGNPHAAGLEGRQVLVYADGDEAGLKARDRWATIATEAGAASVRLLEPLAFPTDFCDVAGRGNMGDLGARLRDLASDSKAHEATRGQGAPAAAGISAPGERGPLRSRLFRRMRGLA